MSLLNNISNIFWVIIIVIILIIFLVPLTQRRLLLSQRFAAIRKIEKKRQSRVITMIHRQETMTLLGFPVARYIDIEDSEQVLRAIRMTQEDMPIDLVLHSPGGLVLASEQIACALKRHKGKVTVFIPHYAMSGGTMVSLAADEIVMDPDAVIGPIDPQLGTSQSGYYPAASIIKALEEPNPNRDDETLILGDVARKALVQVYNVVYSLVKDNMPEDKARELAQSLSDGRWTHDYPITFDRAKSMGLPVTDKMPVEIYSLMELYPQSGQRRPSVEFVPVPYTPQPTKSPGKSDNK
jgi:ClpP class serine protease